MLANTSIVFRVHAERHGKASFELTIMKIDSLQKAIDNAIHAIGESQEQVDTIARSTIAEVERLEAEHERLKEECLVAIATVENLERELRTARDWLMVVSRDIHTYAEEDMRLAYQAAERSQSEVSLWRERETQLRLRRDEVARRLKSLRVTAYEAEILMIKFNQMTSYLGQEFEGASGILDTAKTQLLLSIRMLHIQEEERRNLAGRLHDGAMQSLASMAMRVQAAQGDSITFRQEVRQGINDVITDLRSLVFELRPPLLDDLGLVPTLKRYAEQWANREGVKVRTQLIGIEISLSPTEKVTVFRTVQEGLRNIAQHASAREVLFYITYSPDKLEVQLIDDGLGITEVDWQVFAQSGRMGLILCRERLGAIGGTLELTSASGGAKLLVTIPLGREIIA